MTKTMGVSGQGSQAIGMGMDLLELSAAKDKFAQAEAVLGWSVPEICQSQSDKISRTLSLYVVESILADLMRNEDTNPTWLPVTVGRIYRPLRRWSF